jgi:hypothetical protein
LDRVIKRAKASEAGGKGDISHGQGARLKENPRGLGPLGSRQGKRAGSDLGAQLALDLAHAVAKPARETAHALTVDDTIADQPHRPCNQI